jgi:hypothetical protein
MWIPGHLADIESDMSALHGVDDIWSMPAARFFAFAWRLPHYQGVMRDVVLAEQNSGRSRQPEQQRAIQRAAPSAREAPPPATPAVVRSDPALGGVFSFGSFSAGGAQPDLRETAQQEYPELR